MYNSPFNHSSLEEYTVAVVLGNHHLYSVLKPLHHPCQQQSLPSVPGSRGIHFPSLWLACEGHFLGKEPELTWSLLCVLSLSIISFGLIML